MELSLFYLLAGISALGFLYCQARILKAAKGIPVWRTPKITPLIVSTGLCEGTGLLLMILSAISTSQGFVGLLLLLIVVRSFLWQQYRTELVNDNAPQASINSLARIHWIFLGLANILPALLILLSSVTPELYGVMNFTAGLLVVVGGWHLKYIIVTKASHVQGYALATPAMSH